MTLLHPPIPEAREPLATAAGLRFQLVTDASELPKLADAWRKLLENTARPEPMLSPEWLTTWWELYGQGRSLAMGLFYAQDRLVGLAPLCLRSFTYRPGIRFKRLAALGADGDEPDGVCSDYLNILARLGFESQVAHAFADRLLDGSFGQWDEWVMENMDGNGLMPTLLDAAFARHDVTLEHSTTTEAPIALLPATWDAFVAALPKKKRSSLRSAWRDFETWAGGDFRLEHADDTASLERGQAILKSLHQQRWEEAGKDGVFASNRFEAFHERWMKHLLEHQDLVLSWLTVRGEPIAAAYGFRAGDRVYYYQCGRKLEVPHRIRPGLILLQLLIQDAIAHGMREFDFLGGPARYKSLFTRTSRPLVQLRLARPSWRETLRRTLRVCKSWIS